jgi:hypothetical protein
MHPRRHGVVGLLIKLAYQSRRLPHSLFVRGVVLAPNSEPEGTGGFGDVHKGTLGDTAVAIKKPRVIAGENDVAYQVCILPFRHHK